MTALTITGLACLVADLGSQNPVDLQKLKAASWNGIKCEGVIFRAARSNGLVDASFAQRYELAASLNFLAGAYAFNTGETATIQASRFLGVTRRYGAMFRALDFETNPSGDQMSLATAIEWLDRVDQATGHRSWLYSGDRIKTLIVAATAAQRDFLLQHALWGCEYGPAFKLFDDAGKRLPWPFPTLWQFTGDGVGPEPNTLAGLQTGADLSIFKGDRSDLEAVWSGPLCPAVTPSQPATLVSNAPASKPAESASIGATASLSLWNRILRKIGL